MSVQRKRWEQCWFETDLIVNWVKFVLEVLQAKVLPVFFSAGGDKISHTRPHAAGRRTLPNTRTYSDARRPWWEEQSVSCVPRSEHVTDQWVLNSPLLLLPLYTAYSCQYCTWKKHCFSLIIYTLLILVTKTALKQVLIHYGVTETNEGDLGDSFPVDWFLFKSYKGLDTPNLTARNGICYQLTAATDTHWMPKCWCSWLHPNT